jgi:photosystem II stability/assembly factor-like uncharacterized protein
MRAVFIVVLSLLLLTGCATNKTKSAFQAFNSVIADTILQGKISIRAVLIQDKTIWYAADKGRFGSYNLITHQKTEHIILKDPLSIEFRSIAKTSDNIFLLNVGNPALLYRISKDGNQQLVYHENGEKVFYDSMQFWNDKEGIAVGDPVEDCLSIIITRDGGNTWRKTSCLQLPKVVNGEAAFAASNSNIVIRGNKTWIVSGGKKSRVFYSPDKGKTWQVFETPIVQGLEMTGIFTSDFYNDKQGFVAGGNFEIPNQNSGNKAFTADGGKTWNLIAENQGFGYASCIQYVPDSDGKGLVCVGASGLQYSADSGKTWKQLLAAKNLYTIRFIDASMAVAAGQSIILLLHFKS